jgi:CRP-like cAMP-binding protein
VSHLALFSLLSDTGRRSLLQTAATRQLKLGEVLFAAGTNEDPTTVGFAVVRHGCLDIYCVGSGEVLAPQGLLHPLASLTRGQTFGDQMVALGHPHMWASNPRRRRPTSVCFEVAAGDASTEVLWITRDRVDQLVREDRLRLSYNPIFGTTFTASSTTALLAAIEGRDVCQLTRQLLTDATLSKFFFQFPPLVLERLCHHMELQHYPSDGVVLEAGGTIDCVYVVVTGALHSHCFPGSEGDPSAEHKALVHQGSARRLSQGQDVHFVPGDACGARELMKRSSVCEAPVLADAGTLLLCITRSAFERWVAPMRHNTIVKAGSILQPFVWTNSSPPPSPRHAYTSSYASLVKVNRRQSGPSVFSSAVAEPGRGKAHRLDEAAILLKRLGLFQTLPRFLLAQMLPYATLFSRSAGEELFREGDAHRALVVILSGFVSFYSLENMSATIDMFQKHPFCAYSAFSGSTVSPEDFAAEPSGGESEGLAPSAALKHRAAMNGVHIQTLPSHNAFRTGVLQDGTVCPATVLAQTDCQYLVVDESLYARLLADHVPAVSMEDFKGPEPEPATLSASAGAPSGSAAPAPSPPKPIAKGTDHPLGAIPPALLAYLEAARVPWLPPSSAKKTLLLRSMVHVRLAPGQRLIQHAETLRQIVLVVSGKLAVYVRESLDVTSVLHASQRSVQNVALERRVASNYSTTSQQLYQERAGTAGAASRRALRRKIARIAEAEAPADQPKTPAASSNSRFTDFVLHAAREAKAQEPAQAESLHNTPHAPSASPSTRRSLHSMVKKVKFQRQRDDPGAGSSTSGLKETTSRALFMFYLEPGDIHGDEITAPGGIFRSVHDIYAGTASPGSPGGKDAPGGPSRVHGVPTGTEVLCLDRHVLHSILSKTEEEAANELVGRSSTAKAKWQLASKKLFKRASHSTFEEPGDSIRRRKTPKLFDFFKNILNQRRFLTMGTIAHFPLLRDLPDDTRRELCLNARFEALDRYTDAYKGNGDGNGTGRRFFLLLSGRIHLVANGPNSHVVAQTANASSSDHSLREVCAGEGFGEFEILSPEAPAYVAAIAAEPTKLLSIPAEMFMRHWPCTNEARGNIKYLRTQIPSFSSLDLERIAYLYHSFSFQTHVRGTRTFACTTDVVAHTIVTPKIACCRLPQIFSSSMTPNGLPLQRRKCT